MNELLASSVACLLLVIWA